MGRQRWRESRKKLPLLLDIHTETPLRAVARGWGGAFPCPPIVVRNGGSGDRLPVFKSWLCCFPAVCFWTSYLSPLYPFPRLGNEANASTHLKVCCEGEHTGKAEAHIN